MKISISDYRFSLLKPDLSGLLLDQLASPAKFSLLQPPHGSPPPTICSPSFLLPIPTILKVNHNLWLQETTLKAETENEQLHQELKIMYWKREKFLQLWKQFQVAISDGSPWDLSRFEEGEKAKRLLVVVSHVMARGGRTMPEKQTSCVAVERDQVWEERNNNLKWKFPFREISLNISFLK